MTYTIDDHSHRFTVWSASRAAASSRLCRFSVEQGKSILEACGFNSTTLTIDSLPTMSQFDQRHRDWRSQMKAVAQELKVDGFSDGVAAKLINVYLKSRFVLGGYPDDDRVKAIHPPIDAVLLKELARENVGRKRSVWVKFTKLRWSKFNSEQYEEVIALIKDVMGKDPLWMIEKYWKGFQ